MLNNNQKRHLKSLAHHKKPVVLVGGKGLTAAVLNEIDSALDHHELIKIKINAENREARAEIIGQIHASLAAEVIQQLGHIATFFRRNPDTPLIPLP